MNVLRCLRTGMATLGLALLVPLFTVAPVSAGHVSITVDGDLTDLINEVNANLGADKGGAVTPDPEGTGDIGNGCPYYVNGFDFDTGYIMYDFLDASQDPTADVALYVGFDMVGVVGDVDGNGNPDTETSPTPCNASESPGVALNLELYRIVFDFDCDGGQDLILGVTGDAVRNMITLQEIPGEYAIGTNSDLNANDGRDKLEIGIPLAEVLPEGVNICDVSIRLTSNAVDDFLQEDQGETAYFGIPVAASVTKDPPEQEVCPGDEVSWTIVATNEGLCEATTMTVTDVLDAGLSYVSADPAPTSVVGQTLTWEFFNVPAGDSKVIELVAVADEPCAAGEERINSVEVVAERESECPTNVPAGFDEDTALVRCLPEPCVEVTCTPSAQEVPLGESVTIDASAFNCSDGVETILLQVKDESGTVICEAKQDVEPGQSLDLSCTFACDTEGTHTYTTEAIAANDCGETDVMTSSCDVTCVPEGENCPRTPGFWTQQCAQKNNGSTKFTKEEVEKIAACVDDISVFFDWGDDFAGFCQAINPERPMNQYKQLQRHFAALLANHCTGELGLIANNGSEISLNLGSQINCDTDAETVGELIKEIDDALLNGKEDKYGALLYCADGINNGDLVGVSSECNERDTDDPAPGREVNIDPTSFRLDSPAPNPFRHEMTLTYAVPAENAGQRVDINIYNVAGRLVRNLVSGAHGSGSYEISWNGIDNSGSRVQRGVYFVKARINGQAAGSATRVLYLR